MSRVLLTALLVLTVTVPAVAAENDGAAGLELSAAASTIAPQTELRRPAALTGLYGGFIGLQVLDARTTAGALRRGGHETNPLVGHGPGAMWAVKAASTASTIFFVERIWKKNRVGAVLVMAGINGAYAAIAAHNAKQGR
jgi:hypothetical protein